MVRERLLACLRRAAYHDVEVEGIGVRVAGRERRIAEPSDKGTHEYEDRAGPQASLWPLAIAVSRGGHNFHRSQHIAP
jgi:hypothetical protein